MKLDRRFVEADLRIATGLVEPHFMAGYSGGRKVIAPGVAHADTIRTFHSARFMEDPAAIQCNLAGNPLHEEQLEIVRMLGEVYAVNTVIDEDRDLVARQLRRGDREPSRRRRLRRGQRAGAGRTALCHDPHVGGRPSARQDLLPDGQGHGDAARHPRAGRHADHRVGLLRRASARRNSATSQRRLCELGPDAFLQTLLAKHFADVDEWQTEMQLKSMRVGRVQLYTTGLDDEDRRLTGVDTVDSVEDAIAAALERAGDPALAVIPEGPYVVPVVA